MGLDDLPGELILQIVPLLTRQDYAQLVLVCKDWYSLFIPHLYQHVVLPLNDYIDAKYGDFRWSEYLPVRRFTIALLENPTLAPLIHSLELFPSRGEEKWKHRPPLKPPGEEKFLPFMLPFGDAKRKYRRRFRAWRQDLKDDLEREIWIKAQRYEDAWLALLMVQVKNLERFVIELPGEWDQYCILEHNMLVKSSVHFERVIHWASNPRLGILTHLKHVLLADGPNLLELGQTESAIPLKRLIPYLRIPSLRKLYVHNACDRTQFDMPSDLVLPLTHLDLLASTDGLPNLSRLLERCPKLQSFTLELGDWGDNHTHDYLNHSHLYQPLQQSQSSLHHLNLTFLSDLTEQDAENPTPIFFGRLTGFPNLQTVHIRWGNLLPFVGKGSYNPSIPLQEVLPRSLQHLYIDDCLIQSSWALCCELENLVVHISETVPVLKTLYLRYAVREQAPGQGCIKCTLGHWSNYRMMEADPIIDARLLELQGRFRASGVEFRVIGPGATAVSFPQDGAIRKKWPRRKPRRIMGAGV
ncbi:hypothetical protein AtubIFM55763_000857 [Aspergillus tubingensis]|uniref:F-box domain-containing protein n=1 Tax=Aspergillus tubingensis TaxID=5068 RepID=A0A9W6ERS7_ASPTU|nr:hypothetical protein AtubIFM54640_003623 [Aspergillus tubingensis]GLA70685.1 hypothetical protein AtubIFM55763_000857 [Aspergillus tubingensis]GLA90268.1 hypothetical protein AtubIFM56815_005831 [Aspergillus tubingensis]GLA91485.1 hypothetical protein AtubIFM57143_004985 [Aspergillus tubingensis]GLB23329.1 hypothetical protein AtubIFM61612_003921 [Aspergillus tubingensis]